MTKVAVLLYFFKLCHKTDAVWLEQCSSDESSQKSLPTKKALAELAGERDGLSSRTIYRHQKEFKSVWRRDTETGGFHADARGCYARSDILDHENVMRDFRRWLQDNRKSLTVDLVCEFVNNTLFKDVEPKVMEMYGYKKASISRSGARTLMIRAGAGVTKCGSCTLSLVFRFCRSHRVLRHMYNSV